MFKLHRFLAFAALVMICGAVLGEPHAAVEPADAATREGATTEDSKSPPGGQELLEPDKDDDSFWLPVSQLIADSATVSLVTHSDGDDKPASPSTADYEVIAVRGVYSLKSQVRKLATALDIPRDEAEDLLRIVDFEIQRTTIPIRQLKSRKPEPELSWETIPMQPAVEILKNTPRHVNSLPPDVVHPVITMPLPERANGRWTTKLISHSFFNPYHRRVRNSFFDNPRDDKPPHLDGWGLFRYLDFEAERGKHYAYRVRLKLGNPAGGLAAAKNSKLQWLFQGVTVWTPWSDPASVVHAAPRRDPKPITDPSNANRPQEDADEWVFRDASIPDDLSGKWLMTLPAGFDHTVTVKELKNEGDIRRYRLGVKNKGTVLEGVCEIQRERLVVVEPDDERMTGFAWRALNKNVLLLVEQRLPSPNGANYIGATLSRLPTTGESRREAEARDDGSDEDDAVDDPTEPIGQVLGEPVLRGEIDRDKRLSAELYRLFGRPVMRKYREAHIEQVTPTGAEIAATAAFFMEEHPKMFREQAPKAWKQLQKVEEQLARSDLSKERRLNLEKKKMALQKQLRPPPLSFAKFMLDNWKFQRHLYENYGGGRLLWQQAGIEAFDASWNCLKAHEKKGDFQITDPKLRSDFYEYYTSQDEGTAFLIEDPERIRREFLEPEWAPEWPARK